MSENIIISGATGFIGRKLVSELAYEGYRIIVLSRSPEKYEGIFKEGVQFVKWDGQGPNHWSAALPAAKAVINLAGENIAARRWTRQRKERLLTSRLDTTRALAGTVRKMKTKPEIFMQISAIGYYGNRNENLLDESSPLGKGFLADLTNQWEGAASEISELGIKLCILRTGLVLGKRGGLLKRITPAFRFFLGGHFGKGNQWMSWIHLEDVVRAFQFILKKVPSYPIYNLTAPQPVPARQFFQTVGCELGRPSWLHVPEFLLNLLLAEMARETILVSQRVYPANLLKAGFKFKYSQLSSALQDILGDWSD
jgi:uncharacterized protein (TIGR01777 family)